MTDKPQTAARPFFTGELFERLVALLIALVTVLAAVAAFLQSDAEQKAKTERQPHVPAPNHPWRKYDARRASPRRLSPPRPRPCALGRGRAGGHFYLGEQGDISTLG